MMKRPRSLIATLLVLLCLGAPLAGISATPTESLAGPAGSRLMNPRAGDPDEPGDGSFPTGSGSGLYSPSDPTSQLAPADSPDTLFPISRTLGWSWLLSQLFTFGWIEGR
jgi:hypothetical protein